MDNRVKKIAEKAGANYEELVEILEEYKHDEGLYEYALVFFDDLSNYAGISNKIADIYKDMIESAYISAIKRGNTNYKPFSAYEPFTTE